MYPHRIRLRGPWGCELLPAGLPTADCRLPTTDCRRRFRRRFGYPGRIDAYERVWLTFVGVAGAVEVRLNDVSLGRRSDASGAFEFEVTALLRPRNELVVDVEGTAEQSGLWGEVALEVRCTAFLRGLSWFAIRKGERAELHVTGQVVGVAERPLELYIVLDRSVVAYQVVTATEEGQPFEIVVPDLTVESSGSAIKVDLVNGASVWYTNEGAVTLESRPSLGG